MSITEESNGSTSNGGITEDEAALYDRQIRLWGVEAQNKMRTSSVLIFTLKAVAAEIAKNIVLAGIGTLTLLDDQVVKESALGGNFFLREEDVGSLRVEAAAPRIQALNPRVQIKTVTDLKELESEDFLSAFDVIVLTEVSAPTLLRLNEVTRRLGKKLFAASSIGMDGWIFADLLEHEFVVDKLKPTTPGELVKVPTKTIFSYVPFSTALSHTWTSSTVSTKALKKLMPKLWSTLAIFQTEINNPSSSSFTPEELSFSASTLLPKLGLPPNLHPPISVYTRISETLYTEFSPSAAIIGGIAGQDVLNTLGGKEEPVKNFFVFDGSSGAGNVFQLGV